MTAGRSGWDAPVPVDEALLEEIDATAFELATLAGAEIVAALGRTLQIQYKSGDAAQFRNPVSEIDRSVERLLRDRLAGRFPEHGIIGEEIDEEPLRNPDFVWALDPIDGTSNFINGFPLFAASIGVLLCGRPIAGAVWCATSHALHPGTYHARRGGPLYFEREPLQPRSAPTVRRHLAGAPQGRSDRNLPWDNRKTGSAAIECAFAAAGLLRVVRFARPHLWDVAGGVALVLAAGGQAWVRERRDWQKLESFCTEDGEAGDLRQWRGDIILGEAEAAALLRKSESRQ